MKLLINKISVLFVAISLFASCDSDMKYKDSQVSAVNQLFEPSNDRLVKLLSSANSALFFEWEYAHTEDSGPAMYEVVFYKESDLNNELYRVSADNGGTANFAYITHKLLNKIAGMAGVEAGQTGKVVWTVIASRGMNQAKSSINRTLNITRLFGFTEIPDELFITGEASETGNTIENAIGFKATAQGEFEIYTKLKAGKYQFVDRVSGTPRVFVISGTQLQEKSGESSESKEEGVYRIKVDFNVGSVSIEKINQLILFFAPTQSTFTLNYVEKGTWKASNQYIEFKQEGWGRDERYQFRMKVEKDGTVTEEGWGSKNSDNQRPSDATGNDFYYLYKTPSVDRWNYSFKFASQMDYANVDVFVYFNNQFPSYTHKVVKLN